MAKRPGATGLVAGVLLLLLSGCTSAGDGGDGGGAGATTILESLDGVVDMPGVDSVDDYTSELVVRIAADATDAEVLDIGAAVNAAAMREGREGRIMLNRVGEGIPTETDMLPVEPWSVDVLTADPDEAERRLAGALEVEDLGLGTSLFVSSHWPSVMVDPAVDLGDAVARIAQTELFADGGTYRSGGGEHLTIVHVAKRTTVEAVQTIIAIAADYPTSEFLLQATEEGPQWPHLLVAGLDAQQGATLDARLREPDLADADPEGFAQQFQLTVTGADGPTYIAGTLGDDPPLTASIAPSPPADVRTLDAGTAPEGTEARTSRRRAGSVAQPVEFVTSAKHGRDNGRNMSPTPCEARVTMSR